MTILVLEEGRKTGKVASSRASTDVEADQAAPAGDVPTQSGPSREQIFIGQVRAELDGYFVALKRFGSQPADEVYLQISGITARLGELRMICVRSESRRLAALRTREIDPLIEECDRQFRVHSRIQSVRQFDWEASGKGQV